MKYLSLEEFGQIYDDWKSSGLSVRDYCSNTGVTENKFYYWKKRLEAPSDPSANSFVPIKMKQRSGNLEISMSENNHNSTITGDSGSSVCELVYPNGVSLRINSGMTLEMLRSLISLYP